MTTPAGWYDDGSGRQRWWDGEQWTEHFAPETTDAPGAASADASSEAAPTTEIVEGPSTDGSADEAASAADVPAADAGVVGLPTASPAEPASEAVAADAAQEAGAVPASDEASASALDDTVIRATAEPDAEVSAAADFSTPATPVEEATPAGSAEAPAQADAPSYSAPAQAPSFGTPAQPDTAAPATGFPAPGEAPGYPGAAPALPGSAPSYPGATPSYADAAPPYPGAAPSYTSPPAYPGAAPAQPGASGYPAPAYAAASPYPDAASTKPSVLGLVGLGLVVLGTILSCIPALPVMIVGWIVLPAGFILSIVSLFLKGKKWPGFVGLGLGFVGFIVALIMAFVYFTFALASQISSQIDDFPSSFPSDIATEPEPEDTAETEDLPSTEPVVERPAPEEITAGFLEVMHANGNQNFDDPTVAACIGQYFYDSEMSNENLATIAGGSDIYGPDAAQTQEVTQNAIIACTS